MGCAFRASQSGTIGECAAVAGQPLQRQSLGASANDYLPTETCEVNPHAVIECTDGGLEGKCKESGVDYDAARAQVVALGVACPSELCDSCIFDYCAFGGDISMIEGCIDDDDFDGTMPMGQALPVARDARRSTARTARRREGAGKRWQPGSRQGTAARR